MPQDNAGGPLVLVVDPIGGAGDASKVKLNECFVVGRFKPRRFRAPVVQGWQGDERAIRPAVRVELKLDKTADTYALKVPGDNHLLKLGADASALIDAGGAVDVLIGWPEPLVIVRRDGTLLYGEGDIVHFGRLDLDGTHTIERTGYEYLAEGGSEVRVELTLAGGSDGERTTMLDPGACCDHGPYRLEHDHSFDPSDRPSGPPHHGYFFRVRRIAPPTPSRPADTPHPLDVSDPAPLIELARRRSLLGTDEALWAEPAHYQARVDCYEGPRPTLEQTMRETGPNPPSLTRRGELVAVESPRIARGPHGELQYGRATLELAPTGRITVTRTQLGTLPGRMRKG